MTTGMTALKRALSLLSTLFLTVFLLCACGSETDTSGLTGTGILDTALSGPVTIEEHGLVDHDLSLRLDPGGNGVISDSCSEGRIRWHYEQGVLAVQTGEISFTGTMDGKDLVLQPEGSELQLRFVPPDAAASAQQNRNQIQAFLGSWYGWWKIEQSDGEMLSSWYDCCAEFQLRENGLVLMTLWDEDGSRDSPLASVTLDPGDDGSLSSLYGYFYQTDLKQGDWRIEAPRPAVFLSDIQYDEKDEHFRYSVYLRKWGDRWSDAPEDQKPFYFEDWYLPRINKGSDMPDSIPWKNLEIKREQKQN